MYYTVTAVIIAAIFKSGGHTLNRGSHWKQQTTKYWTERKHYHAVNVWLTCFFCVCRWVTLAECAAAVRAVQCWQTRTSWVLSQLCMSWPPERDSSTAGWAASGRSSSRRYVTEVRGSLYRLLLCWLAPAAIWNGGKRNNTCMIWASNKCDNSECINLICLCVCLLSSTESVSPSLGKPCTHLFFSLCESFVRLSALIGRHSASLSYFLHDAQGRDVTSLPLLMHTEHFLDIYKE